MQSIDSVWFSKISSVWFSLNRSSPVYLIIDSVQTNKTRNEPNWFGLYFFQTVTELSSTRTEPNWANLLDWRFGSILRKPTCAPTSQDILDNQNHSNFFLLNVHITIRKHGICNSNIPMEAHPLVKNKRATMETSILWWRK